jgi:hypothetical protein
MSRQENIVAYWQSARSNVADSRIESHTQEILSYNGSASYCGFIIGAFAAERTVYSGISSDLPDELMERREVLKSQGIELNVIPAGGANLVTRVRLRQTLELGKDAVAAALLDGARYLPTGRFLSAEDIMPNTGRLYIPSDDETLPEDLQRMIDIAAPLDAV